MTYAVGIDLVRIWVIELAFRVVYEESKAINLQKPCSTFALNI